MDVTINEKQAVDYKKKLQLVYSNNEMSHNKCPIRDVLDRFGDKWSIYTIILLGQSEKLRFNELKTKINGISQRMLTVTLRSLEQDGLVERKIFPEIPPRVEYKLTILGNDLLKHLLSMAEWAQTNMESIINARKQYATKQENNKTLN
jgi:DNA-binding HxlR family transcriptional regulator